MHRRLKIITLLKHEAEKFGKSIFDYDVLHNALVKFGYYKPFLQGFVLKSFQYRKYQVIRSPNRKCSPDGSCIPP